VDLHRGTENLRDKLSSLLHPQPHLSLVTIWMFVKRQLNPLPCLVMAVFHFSFKWGMGQEIQPNCLLQCPLFTPRMRFWVRKRDFIYGYETACINSPNSHTYVSPLQSSIFGKCFLILLLSVLVLWAMTVDSQGNKYSKKTPPHTCSPLLVKEIMVIISCL
jgi:hypothetical protein